MNSPQKPIDVRLAGIQETLNKLDKRVSDLEAAQLTNPPSDDANNPLGNYAYWDDYREPTQGMLKAFKDRFGVLPPEGMQRGHIWLSLHLLAHPENRKFADPEVVSQIESVTGPLPEDDNNDGQR